MRKRCRLSLFACILICAVLIAHRLIYPAISNGELKVTTWDALGYYSYLPAFIIYKDISEFSWFEKTEAKYELSGRYLYQADKQDNGKYVFKYLGGVAFLQLPFFIIAHNIAASLGFPADGFSSPYQYAIAWSALIYCMLAIFLLRRVLLYYFDDRVTALCLLLLTLATNFVQYAAVESAMSHAYIFPLYVLVLYATIKWHAAPRMCWAILTGYSIGLATICRPTEAIMLFIPLFWDMQDKTATARKWEMVLNNKPHVIAAVLAGVCGVLPQLIYWKYATGSWIFDVGSSWRFADPFFRVLFGWEKGWFIYTPVTVLFVTGLFFMRSFPFAKSVFWFCLLNIYIIISWADWQYGASYSTRALVQSYPVFALPLAAFVNAADRKAWRYLLYAVGVFLIVVNIFQVYQYNKGILHFRDMNNAYYSRIYLNPDPEPLDISLMDNADWIGNEDEYRCNTFGVNFNTVRYKDEKVLLDTLIAVNGDSWLRADLAIKGAQFWDRYIVTELIKGDSVKSIRIRMDNPLGSRDVKTYAFYMHVPRFFHQSRLRMFLTHPNQEAGDIVHFRITRFEK